MTGDFDRRGYLISTEFYLPSTWWLSVLIWLFGC